MPNGKLRAHRRTLPNRVKHNRIFVLIGVYTYVLFNATELEGPFQRRKFYIAIPPLAPVQSGAVGAKYPSSLLPEYERATSRAPGLSIIFLVRTSGRIEKLSSPLWVLHVEVRREDWVTTTET